MRSQTKKKLAALNSVTFIMVFGNALLIPGFPQIMAAIDISLFQVSLLVTGYSIAAGCFIPIFGFLSDHLKRKNVILFALVFYGLGGIIIGTLAALNWDGNIFPLILGGRVVQGIGAAGMSPIAMALVGDIFTTEERAKALGLIEFSNIAGKIVSPILGSALFLLAWYVPFFIYGLFVIPVLAAMILLIKEPETKNKTPLKKY
ncbi:MAG TPA: MFS transporter, partial [Firmicutes bacterium]|nr:MFS transporter [Bacillota bacterium]